MGYRVVDLIADHLTRLPTRPVFRPVPPALAREMVATPVPMTPTSPDAILDTIRDRILAYPMGNGHPAFAGWVNAPPTVMGIFADALAATMNPNVAGGNQAAVYIEHEVLAWFKELLGFPASATGQLVSGSSAAALTALGVARHVAMTRSGIDARHVGLQHARTTFTVYQSEQGHSCHRKAFETLGIGSSHIREIESDAALRMSPSALEAALAGDVREGRTPVAVIASAGTVNTGAIDPLDAIADVCAAHGVWLHVDGAYGAPAILTERYAGALAAIARADSVATDPHKWMSVPLEAGLVLIKDATATRATYAHDPPYLRTDGDPRGVTGPPWFSELGLQQTRGFRALKVWASIAQLGRVGYRAAIEHTLAMAEELAERVRGASDLELWEPTSLSIVCFRYVGDHTLSPAALDAVNGAVCTELQLGGVVFPSSTVLAGRTYVRACIVHPGSRPGDGERLVQLTREIAARLAREQRP